MKCKLSCPGFELVSPYPFPMMVSITPYIRHCITAFIYSYLALYLIIYYLLFSTLAPSSFVCCYVCFLPSASSFVVVDDDDAPKRVNLSKISNRKFSLKRNIPAFYYFI